MKTSNDNSMINHTGVVYAENDTKLSRPIRPGAIYNENQTGQQHDQSYRYGLQRKQNWIVRTYQTRCSP